MVNGNKKVEFNSKAIVCCKVPQLMQFMLSKRRNKNRQTEMDSNNYYITSFREKGEAHPSKEADYRGPEFYTSDATACISALVYPYAKANA